MRTHQRGGGYPLGEMTHDLEIALKAARNLRDWGNLILLIGILVEIGIDVFWPEPPSALPLLRGQRATQPLVSWRDHVLSARVFAMLVTGLVILAGLTLERVEGNKADDAADNIRARLELDALGNSQRRITPEFAIFLKANPREQCECSTSTRTSKRIGSQCG